MAALPKELFDLDALVADMVDMEPLPPTATRLLGIMAAEAWSLEEIESVLKYDPVLTARVIQIANSPAFSPRTEVTDVRRAVMQLGAMQIVSIAVAVAAKARIQKPLKVYGVTGAELWEHSVAAALGAEAAAKCLDYPVPPSDAFVVGLLHDIGKVVLAGHLLPEVHALLLRDADARHVEHFRAEAKILSVHHGQLGGIVAERWGLPEGICRAVQHHHEPAEAKQFEPLATMAWLGNLLAKEAGSRLPGEEDFAIMSDALDNADLSQEEFLELAEDVRTRLDDVLEWYR